MGTFQTSEGERLSKDKIRSLTDNAKKAFKKQAIEDGKGYCWACGKTNEWIAASHIISVDHCQNDGMTEFCWDFRNLQLECNSKCHIETETRKFSHHANARYKKTFIEYYNELKSIVRH